MSRIALIDYDISVIGGVEKVTERLANNLSAKYSVFVISLNQENDVIPYKFNKGIKVFFTTNNKDKRLRKAIMKNFGRISKILKVNKIDIALCMGHYATFVTVFNKKYHKTKLIYCDHGAYINSIDDKIMCFIRKFNYQRTCHTVLLTKRNKDDYIKYINAKENKLSYIYNCIPKEDLKNYKSVKYNNSTHNIVTISRLSSEKGIDLLVEVAYELKKICKESWEWHIYGDGSEKDDIIYKINKHNLSSNIILKGADRNAKQYLKNYSLYCLTSYHEGLPLVLLEAKVNKLPIVSFNVTTGPDEIVKNDVNGYLIDCYDVKAMANKIKYLLEHDDVRYDFSQKTIIDIEKFNEKEIMNQWYKLIEKMKEK